MDLKKFKALSLNQSKGNKKFLSRLKKGNPREVDAQFHKLHEEVFNEIDCLTCANCCKTTSPIFRDKDIERLAHTLKVRPAEFIEKYLKLDSDQDYVLTTAPCPFLNGDNTCSVYEDRPKACREYPHTDRKKMVNILDLTHKNTLVCPAVLEIVTRLRSTNM